MSGDQRTLDGSVEANVMKKGMEMEQLSIEVVVHFLIKLSYINNIYIYIHVYITGHALFMQINSLKLLIILL